VREKKTIDDEIRAEAKRALEAFKVSFQATAAAKAAPAKG